MKSSTVETIRQKFPNQTNLIGDLLFDSVYASNKSLYYCGMPRYVEKGSQKQPEAENKQKEPEQAPVQPKPQKPQPAAQPQPRYKPKYVEKTSDASKPNDKQKPAARKDQPNPNPKADNKGDHPTTQPKPKRSNQGSYRQRRSKYDWNRSHITPDTVVPDMPKKILAKPDGEALDKNLDEMEDKIRELEKEMKEKKRQRKEDIRAVKDEKYNINRLSSANQGKLRELQAKRRKARQSFSDLVASQRKILNKLKELKEKSYNLRVGSKLEYRSEAQLLARKQELDRTIITKDLSKQEARRVQEEINQISRALVNAREDHEIELQEGQAKDMIRIEKQQLDKLNLQINKFKAQMDDYDKKISQIESIKQTQQKTVKQVRDPADIEQQYQKQLQRIDDTIYNLQDQIQSAKQLYRHQLEDYREQQELIEWIEFATKEKKLIKEENERIEKLEKERKIEQEKRKKEREQDLQEKQRKKEEYEKKKKEREAREQREKEELEKKLNSMPFDAEKNLCNFLIDYCEKLKPEKEVQTAEQKERKEVELKGGDWDKETKKGAHLIANKKEKELVNELDISKKTQKKETKKIQKKPAPEQAHLDHTIQVIRLFEQLHIVPPEKRANLDETIAEVRKKFDYFNNPSEEDIKKHREKVAQEHERNQRGEYTRDRPERQQQREREPKESKKAVARPVINESDFPNL